MKTKDILLASLVLTVLPMNAQETYQDVKMVPNELNGTARYVGMGGALEALGADISTIQSNPAGLGLFRKSWVGLSGGFVSQSDAETSMNMGSDKVTINGNKTNASFDQVGVVWSIHSDRDSYLNLAFNYDKSRNFDQILDAVGNLNGSSQNKNTALKYDYGKTLNKSLADMLWNSVDAGYAQMLTYDATNNQYGYLDGSMYAFGQYQKGYIGNYNFAISGNIHNRVYLGVTFGYYDVNYRSNSYYTENLENNTVSESVENLKIDGDGFDIKMGAIFFPIENSPFRIGLYINTPVFYDLTSVSTSIIRLSAQSSTSSSGMSNSSYNFRLNTPWKFGVSLGHTIDKILAFGFTYEFADYGSIDNRIKEDGYYDAYDDVYYDASSSSDEAMNHNTKETLKGVSTLKLGVEYKPISSVAFRIGYNYVSPIFETNGFRDGTVLSPGTMYASSTDYTNWKSTNRFTFGVGYNYKKLTFDLAYQYSQQKGDFYPFMSYNDGTTKNVPDATAVENNRHQMLFTVGYKF